jgi:hypothetical protein
MGTWWDLSLVIGLEVKKGGRSRSWGTSRTLHSGCLKGGCDHLLRRCRVIPSGLEWLTPLGEGQTTFSRLGKPLLELGWVLPQANKIQHNLGAQGPHLYQGLPTNPRPNLLSTLWTTQLFLPLFSKLGVQPTCNSVSHRIQFCILLGFHFGSTRVWTHGLKLA